MEWQPIETAPLDGTWVLLLLPQNQPWGSDYPDIDGDHHERITLGRHSAGDYQSKGWMSDKTYTEFWDYGGYTGAGTTTYSLAVSPIAWARLPAVPPRSADG